jgi:hypothetical protein
MRLRLFLFYLLSVYFCPFSLLAQSASEDSSLYRSALAHTLDTYYSQVGDQSAIYNGRLYSGYGFSFKAGIPYFLSGEFRNESLFYDGIQFENIPLLYDNLSEVLITRDRGYWVQLVNERIGSFTIAGHRFIRIVTDSLNRSLSGTGFYEILYQGHTIVLKKTVKKIREELSSSEGILRFIDSTEHYYIKMGNAYFTVSSRRAMLDIFSDRKSQIRQFIKKNKLKYRKDKENTMVKVTGYYDQITK